MLPLASLVTACGVIAGAFGAHALRGHIDPSLYEAYEKGVLYHLVHGVALVAIALSTLPEIFKRQLGRIFVFAIVVFSGSLYLLAITGIRWLGAITPIGGVAMIIGWCWLGLRGRTREGPHDS